ncbi:unnamed protein product, partial [Urochloa humidicola]
IGGSSSGRRGRQNLLEDDALRPLLIQGCRHRPLSPLDPVPALSSRSSAALTVIVEQAATLGQLSSSTTGGNKGTFLRFTAPEMKPDIVTFSAMTFYQMI